MLSAATTGSLIQTGATLEIERPQTVGIIGMEQLEWNRSHTLSALDTALAHVECYCVF
jgi:hypothetical protein